MSGESWLAFKDSLTHQSWFSRLGIQCCLFFSDGVCFLTVLLIFPFSTLFSLFMIWDVTGGGLGPGALGAAWFGAAFTFLIFYKLFNSLMEALLTLARPYGQTKTEELSSWKLFNIGKTYLIPSY